MYVEFQHMHQNSGVAEQEVDLVDDCSNVPFFDHFMVIRAHHIWGLKFVTVAFFDKFVSLLHGCLDSM